jgi:hypothetical protein
MVRRGAIALSLLAGGSLLMVAGCSSPNPAPPATTQSASPAPQMGDPTPPPSDACPASAKLPAQQNNMPEMQGVGRDATLFGLFFSPQATVGQQIKVVFRMTGAGNLSIVATGPGGRTLHPVWGPEQHSASTYLRPGDEWGTGWTFPATGCWTIQATRTTGSAKIAIRVGK